MNHIVFVALDARFTHSNPAIRSILAWVNKHVVKENLPAVTFLEQNINQPFQALLARLYEAKADAIFFSTYIWNVELVFDILPELRQILPDALLGVGGPEVAYTAEELLRDNDFLDLVFTGEGERALETLLPLLKAVNSPSFRQGALGLIDEQKDSLHTFSYKDQKGNITVLENVAVIDLNDLPFIYDEHFSHLDHRYVYYESSRGCPFHCSYCLSSIDDILRFRSLDKVFKDIDSFLANKIPLVKFIDRSFNCNPGRARAIWQYIMDQTLENISNDQQKAQSASRKEKNKFPGYTRFHFEIEARLLEEEDFALLATAPQDLFQFEIGIQSFNPLVLKNIHRSTDTKSILTAIQRLEDKGNIHCHADLLFGLPGQDLASIARSFRIILSSRADKIQLGFLKILKGTPMLEEAKKRKFKWQKRAPYEVLSTDRLSFGDLCRLKYLEAVFERFWNKALFPRSIEEITLRNEAMSRYDYLCFYSSEPTRYEGPSFDSFDFFHEAGRYFMQKGYLSRSLSQNEFFYRFYKFCLSYGFSKDSPLCTAIREDYVSLAKGSLGSFEKLEELYS